MAALACSEQLTTLAVSQACKTITLIGNRGKFFVLKGSPFKLPIGISEEKTRYIQTMFRSLTSTAFVIRNPIKYCGKISSSDCSTHIFRTDIESIPSDSADGEWIDEIELFKILSREEIPLERCVIKPKPILPYSRLIINLVGTTGSGKGMQGSLLTKEFDIPHISLGDLYRNECIKKTIISKITEQFKSYEDAVSESASTIAYGLLIRRISQEDCKKGFILEGFPRTVEQCKVFASTILNPNDRHIPIFLHIAKEDVIYDRLQRRFICKNCGLQVRNLEPNQETKCSICKTALTKRIDDIARATISQRLDFFGKHIPDVLSEIALRDPVYFIDGMLPVEKVYEQIKYTIKTLP